MIQRTSSYRSTQSTTLPPIVIKNASVYSKKHTRKITIGKSVHILQVPTITVIHNDVNVTPKKLEVKGFKFTNFKQDFQSDTTGASARRSRSSRISSQLRLHSDSALSLHEEAHGRRRTTVFNLGNLDIDKNILCDVGKEEVEVDVEVPSGLYLPRMSSKIILPQEIQVFLQETETTFLFGMASLTAAKGTEEADLIEKQNEDYDYLTIGKGRNRKTISTEAQTIACILKTRHTVARRTKKKNSYAFASVWDMFDSYEKQPRSDTMIKPEQSEIAIHIIQSKEDIEESEEEKAVRDILTSTSFLNAVIIMERVLANNNFKLEQEDYKQLLIREEIADNTYIYELKQLWIFSYYKIGNRPVNTVATNTSNTDIIAVGYGKFKYSDAYTGVICVWSIKNPTQPERYYTFPTSVTSVSFSKLNPNLLAAGFYNGDVCVLDITCYKTNIIAKSSRKSSPCYQPVWNVQWYRPPNADEDEENVLAVSQDGRINSFVQTKTKDFICTSMMRVIRSEGNVKSVYEEDWCAANEIPILRHTVCNLYCPHPTLPDIYFIGTSDGSIYKCSKYYRNQQVSFFWAHDGPVYGIEFSKFWKDIFVTCGADWTVKIWRENVLVPLILLTNYTDPVMSASFSPTHSTIIATVSGTSIFIWNIQEKIDTPTLILELPDKFEKLSSIYFTENGKNLLVSDLTGQLHLYSLVGVPEPVENQKSVLETAICKILLIRPELLKQLSKAEKFHK